MIKYLPLLLALSACGITPSADRIFNPDEEFAKLDGPEILTVEASLNRSAIDAVKMSNYDRAAGLYMLIP